MERQNFDAMFCGKQPLHDTNQIQPHGVVLVVSKEDLRIVQVSANFGSIFGNDSPTGKHLSDVVSDETFEEIQHKTTVSTGSLSVILSVRSAASKQYLSLIHEKDGCLIIETEFRNLIEHAQVPISVFLSQLQAIMSEINRCNTIVEVAAVCAKQIKRLSGFDKVMVYSFDDEWNGTVIAEEMEEGMDTYLGLKFPASDVPKQARDLYLKNPYRVIPDRDYQPIDLIPEINPVTGMRTNLSGSRLRSVLPVHIEYLKNMNVMASMSTRIIHREQLWGLIACHHRTDKFLSFGECSTFELLSNVISSKVSSIVNRDAQDTTIRLKESFNEITDHIFIYDSILNALMNYRESLLRVLSAEGFAICWDGRIVSHGLVPEKEEIEDLIDWLSEKKFSKILSLNSLSSGYEKAKAYADVASGLLALAIQPDERRYILAFRGEVIKKVTWGGNPDNVLTIQKDTGTYHPRNSFSVWKETVRNTSAPWSPEELSIAERFRNVVVEHTLQSLANSLEKKVQERTEALEASKKDLETTFNELMQMTYVASHDLQEPVRKIQIFSNKLRNTIGEGQGRESLDRVLAASKRISGLLGDLVNYSLLSHNAAQSPTDLNKIVHDVVADFDLAISDNAISIDVSELPVVQAVPDQMRQVFYSLLSNAIKFARQDIALKVTIRSSWETSERGDVNTPSRYYRIDVADNGVGFNEAYSRRAFEMFGTLHNRDQYEGRGIGLAIAKKIIDRYQGTISASSIPGEGSTFTLRLPERMVL